MKKTSLKGRKHRVSVVEPLAHVMPVPILQPQASSPPAVGADVTLLLGSISNEFTLAATPQDDGTPFSNHSSQALVEGNLSATTLISLMSVENPIR